MKFLAIVRLLEADRWRLVARRGDHSQYDHPGRPGKVTIAGRPADDVPRGTAANVLRQAGIRGTRP